MSSNPSSASPSLNIRGRLTQFPRKVWVVALPLALMLCTFALLCAQQAPALGAQQAPIPERANPDIPEWAYPSSPTHTQVAPPKDFRRPSRNFNTPIGVFEGQSDVGAPYLPGSASYNAGAKQYSITAAGYNIWYQRDEFRYLWKKMSGDISLGGTVKFPDPNVPGDRKVVFIIRQDLDDDSVEIISALHGDGHIRLAQRTGKGGQVGPTFRINAPSRPPGAPANISLLAAPNRIGLEKKGDVYSLYVSQSGGPLQQVGQTLTLHINEPFYVGIGFCSHLPDKADTGVVSDLILENAAGKLH